MTSQNELPAWSISLLRIGAVLVAVTLAFAALHGSVSAIDYRLTVVEDDDARDDEKLAKISEIQVRVLSMLERIEEKIDDLDEDMEQHTNKPSGH